MYLPHLASRRRKAKPHIALFLTYPTIDHTLLAESVLETVRVLERVPTLSDIPVHWCCPTRGLGRFGSQSSRLLATLRSRIASGRDSIFAMGYSAAPHPLLLPVDVARDLDWSVANEWQSGITDLFDHADPTVLVPYPDFARETTRELYARFETRLCLPVAGSRQGNPARMLVLQRGAWCAPHCLEVPEDRPGALPALADGFLRRSDTDGCLLADAVGLFETGKIEELAASLRTILEAVGPSLFVAIPEMPLDCPPKAVPETSTPPLFSPRFAPEDRADRRDSSYAPDEVIASARRYRDGADAAALRRNPVGDSTGNRLSIISAADSHAAGLELPDQDLVPARELIADMSGSTGLDDGGLAARFSGGRLSGLVAAGRQPLLTASVRSYFSWGGGQRDFGHVGAFSFEGESARGLREQLSISAPEVTDPGRLTIDYYFAAGYPQLFVTVCCTFPRFRLPTKIGPSALFDIPVFSIRRRESLRVETRYPNGEWTDSELNESTGSRVYFGTAFRFVHNGDCLLLSFPEVGEVSIEGVPVRLVRAGKRYVVWVSPFGSFGKSDTAEWDGFALRGTFCLNAGDAETVKPVPVRYEVSREIPPYTIGRLSTDPKQSRR